MEEILDKKYKKVPNNENVIEVDGKVILSFDPRYKEYLKWRDENPDLEQQLIDDLEQEIRNKELHRGGAPHKKGDIWEWYNEEGIKFLESEMDGDEYNGELKEYYQNGNLKSKENFVNGVLDGKYEYYYENGNLRQSGCIINTFKEGEVLSYYESGISKSIETYILGSHSGLQKYFYEDGTVSQEGVSKDNRHVGLWTWYWPNGEKLKEVQFVDKILYRISEWQDDGIEISTKKYNNGMLNGKSIFYHHNGNISTVKTYNDGKLYGEYIDYFVSGERRSKGNMKYGMMDGEWTFWFHNGEKELECEFDFGNPIDGAKIYHDNGVLKEVASF
jgi:antitoxin component YwqK of YwqJK toxin-antitoxin module